MYVSQRSLYISLALTLNLVELHDTCHNSPEVALDLVLDVARAGRAKNKRKKRDKGIGNIWQFDTNADAAEAFSFVLKRADKVRRAFSARRFTSHRLAAHAPKF